MNSGAVGAPWLNDPLMAEPVPVVNYPVVDIRLGVLRQKHCGLADTAYRMMEQLPRGADVEQTVKFLDTLSEALSILDRARDIGAEVARRRDRELRQHSLNDNCFSRSRDDPPLFLSPDRAFKKRNIAKVVASVPNLTSESVDITPRNITKTEFTTASTTTTTSTEPACPKFNFGMASTTSIAATTVPSVKFSFPKATTPSTTTTTTTTTSSNSDANKQEQSLNNPIF